MDINVEHDFLNEGVLRYKHLLGKKFKLGETDCYSLLCDMFRDNVNIELTNYARPTDFWHNKDINIYVDNYHKEGFRLIDDPKVEDLRPLDVFLVAIPDPRSLVKTMTNHCLVYLSKGFVIHHRYGELSSVVPYRGPLRNLTTHIIRHKDVPDMRPKFSDKSIDLMDLILPHKRLEMEEAKRRAEDEGH